MEADIYSQAQLGRNMFGLETHQSAPFLRTYLQGLEGPWINTSVSHYLEHKQVITY